MRSQPSSNRLTPASSVALPLLMGMAALFGFLNCSSGPKWPSLLQEIRSRYPGVSQISAETLNTWLSDPDSLNRPILLDTRAPEEFAVSQLHGAELAPDEQTALQRLQERGKDQRIVLYCSVGYRSSGLAEKLMKDGFTNVSNLEGSIFAWANEGRPVYRDDRQVEAVHPYDKNWGKLLKRNLWAMTPQ